MTQPNIDDIFGGMFGGTPGFPRTPATPTPPKTEKGVPWEAKEIDGQYYIPLRQVSELLDTNGVLPKVSKGIKARVAAKKAEQS